MSDEKEIPEETIHRMKQLDVVIRLAEQIEHQEEKLKLIGYDLDHNFAQHLISQYEVPGTLLSLGMFRLQDSSDIEKDIKHQFMAYGLKNGQEYILENKRDEDKEKEDTYYLSKAEMVEAIYYLGLIHLAIGVRIHLGELPRDTLNKILKKKDRFDPQMYE